MLCGRGVAVGGDGLCARNDRRGHGDSIALAGAYPHAETVGYDADAASIADAERFAADRNVTARFVPADVTAVAGDGPYDVVVLLEVLHDLPHPVEALAACRAALADGGAVVVADELVADRFTAPGDELERMMYGWSVAHCLPATRAHGSQEALGTVLRAEVLRDLAARAGFREAATVAVDGGFFRIYRLTP